jgi:hypothetical protein
MQLDELTVEVRNASLQKVGQLSAKDLVGATFVVRYNNVGSWSVRLSPTELLADVLRSPGSGLILTGPTGVIISGPTRTAKLEQTTENNLGVWVIEGTDDAVVLSERLAYPDPSQSDVSLQGQAFDTRTGAAETVIKGYVEDNISGVAGTDRAIPNLLVEPDEGRGQSVTGRARFVSLQELAYPLAQTGAIGYQVIQDGSGIEFKVYEPRDLTASIRMDLDNGKLTRTEYSYVSPQATRAIVGGSGEAVDRVFYEGTSLESIKAETVWGRRIEIFLDDRGTETANGLDQKAQELLVDNGKTIVNFAVTPSDDVNMKYGYDWGLGDLVTVVINDAEASSVVNEIGIAIGSDGVRIAATLGTPNATDFESRLIQRQLQTENRVGNLERSVTGYGVNVAYQPSFGTTTEDQPSFDGPGVTGTYNRFGNMVHFNVTLAFTNALSFGTGQYYLTLPYPAKGEYFFREGNLYDLSADVRYHTSGELEPGSSQVILYTTASLNTRTIAVPFTSTIPVALTTSDRFYISGTYEIEGQ